LPSFTARGVYTRNQYEAAAQLPGGPRIVITPQNQWDGFLTLDVPIVDVAKHHRYASAKAIARASKWEQQATHLDVARSVTSAYYQFLGASALGSSARQSVKLAEANLQSVQDRRDAGAATDLDRERAVANVERAKQDVADAELVVALSSRRLETLSGVVPTPALGFPRDALRAEAPLEQWLARSGATPRERAAREVAVASAQAAKAARATFFPTLSGVAQERFTNATGFGGESPTYTLQLIATWRLDFGLPANVSAQSAATEVQTVRIDRARRAVSDSIFEAHQRVRAGIAKSRAARAQAAAAKKAAELASDRYEAGVATQLDVTQAQRDAFQADANRIQADADLAFARASLRLAAGLSPSNRGTR
jgi:outer membrane protein TolC